MTDPKFEHVLFVPWGDGETGIKPHFEPATQYSFMPEPDKRLKSAPVSLRLDSEGGIHLLDAPGSAISTYFPKGDFVRKTFLESLKNGTVIDFSPDSDWFIVLSRTENGHFNLQKINDSGIALWTRYMEDEIPSPDKLTFSNGRLYIFSQSNINTLLEISILNGDIIEKRMMPESMIRPFGTATGELVGTIYSPDIRRRGITIYSPENQTQTKTICTKELYGPLASNIGTDNEKNVYLFASNDTVSTYGILKVDEMGNLLNRIPFPMIYADKGHELFTFILAGNGLKMKRSGTSGKEQLIPLSEEIRPYLPARLNIVGLEKNNLVFDLLKKENFFERRVLIGLDGKFIRKIEVTEGTVINHIPSYVNWAVSGDGTIFFPVCDENGVVVIKVKL